MRRIGAAASSAPSVHRLRALGQDLYLKICARRRWRALSAAENLLEARPRAWDGAFCSSWRYSHHLSWARGRLDDAARRGGRTSQARAALMRPRAIGLEPRVLHGSACASSRRRRGTRRARWRCIDEAFGARAMRVGQHRWDLAFLHRLRGEILLKRDPPDPRLPRKPSWPPSPSRSEQGARSFEPARGAVARQALPIDRPPRRSSRRPRARARRLCADARNAGDRRGAGAVGGYRGRRACEARINTAMGWLSCYSE